VRKLIKFSLKLGSLIVVSWLSGAAKQRGEKFAEEHEDFSIREAAENLAARFAAMAAQRGVKMAMKNLRMPGTEEDSREGNSIFASMSQRRS
jgi:hypothetical protein